MDQSWPASDLLTLLDDAIGSDNCHLDSAGDASKNKLNMNKLYEFLANLAKNQFILQGLVDAHNQVFENSKNRFRNQMSVAKRPSNLPSKVNISDEVDSHTIINPIKPSSSNESASFEKPPLPDLKSDSKFDERKSTEPSISRTSLSSNLKQSQLSLLALNYAPQYEVDKLSKKLNHLNSKVNNLTKVNAELSVDKKRNSVSEQWSKHVLQKRIDTNEETLGKFSEMFDDLSAQIDLFKQDVNSALENTQAGDGAEIEKLKKKLQSVSDHLNESKSRLAACEGLVPEFESLSSKMLELSNSVKKSVEENSDLAKAQNSFEKMLLALEKKLKNATLAEGQEPTESAGLDFETMKQIDDIQNSTNKLTTRVSVIEEECAKFCKKEDVEDSVNLVKTQVLTDTAEKIAENFNVINEKVGQLDEENSRLNELIEMREVSPAKGITESQLKGLNQENEKRRGSIKNKIHDLDEDINKRIAVLHTEMTANIESLDAELNNQRKTVTEFEASFDSFQLQTKKELTILKNSHESPQKDTPNVAAELGNVSVIPSRVLAMIERMEKDIFSLQNQDKEISKRIDGLRNDADKRDVKLANLSIDIENLKNVKADKSDLDMLQTTKADKTDLNMKVSRNDFDDAFADLSEQMNDLIVQVANQEKLTNEMFKQNEEAMGNKLEQGDLAPFQTNLENRLLSLKKLLEKTKHAEGDANVQESEYSALARKPMQGYKCVTCDKVTYPMPGDPVASIPMSGTMPHLATIRPFTTFDISGIRQAKTGHEAVDFFERKTKLDARYRSKVAETMNYAFDAYKQEMMDEQLIPVAGGASIPKQYHISKPGRSCGGIHTRTTPHKRWFTQFTNVGDTWMGGGSNYHEEAPDDELQQNFEKSKQEVELMGHDGHIYRGRDRSSKQ